MSNTGPEHKQTRLPLIDRLISLGWKKEQIQFDPEWRVPKTPSEATKREEGKSFKSYPVDIAIFDSPENLGSWEHIELIFETKSPDKRKGLSQLEAYLSLEPRVLAGFWTNSTEVAALFRRPDGRFKKIEQAKLPRPSDNFISEAENPIKWDDLRILPARDMRSLFQRLLEHIVSVDSISTRRDDQLNQLCNLLLVKLESDKKAKIDTSEPVVFQVWKDEKNTSNRIRDFFKTLQLTYSDLFSSLSDTKINLEDSTIHRVCFVLSAIKLLDPSIDILSMAFQVFRTASLKSEEGQYFTPLPVIRSAVRIMDIDYDDKVIDPACGSGGFLLECFRSFKEKYPTLEDSEAKAWAQKHLYGIDKDEINIKLTKAMMMILGDGSAHTYLGDSLRSHQWPKKWPYLVSTLKDHSYTCIVTNPPFGKNLKLPVNDARHSGFSISWKPTKSNDGSIRFDNSSFVEREVGLAFLERCYNLLVDGGRLGIVLPETYFFSATYLWLQDWLKPRFLLRGMFNIPMEAFQGFCRAKTNFYVFERI